MKYLSMHPPGKATFSPQEIETLKNLKFTGQRTYNTSPGTAYYFPLIYAPQATALLIGELNHWTIDESYRLARFFATLSALTIICLAFRLFPAPPLILTTLALPMSLFQLSSASLDGVANALAIFTISLFMRIARDKTKAPSWSLVVLAIAFAILASSRIHAAPMIILLMAAFFYTKRKTAIYSLLAAGSFVLLWTIYAMRTTVDLRVSHSASATTILAYYLQNPAIGASVLWNTLTNPELTTFYKKSFIGILGWLDASFRTKYYSVFESFILIIGLLSISVNDLRLQWRERSVLICSAIASTLFVFLALLLTWTPHPASVITGVQGRYFMIPAYFLAYGISRSEESRYSIRSMVTTKLWLIYFIISISASSALLIKRYYLVR